MLRKLSSTVLSFMLVLTLLACAVQPVFAEAPPPPGDEGAAPAAASSLPPEGGPAVPDEKPQAESEKAVVAVEASPLTAAAAPALDFSQWVSPPVLDTGGTAPATTAAFVSDEQMLDSGGVLRAQGETLAALFETGAIACPAGKIPFIYGGSSDTGCTPYYALTLGVNNPIQQAHDNPKTITGWWIWVSQNYLNNTGPFTGTTLAKSVTVKGDPLGTSVTGGIAMDWSSITLRDLVVRDGRVTSTGRSGTLRLQGVNVTGTFADQYGIYIVGHKGSIALTNVTSTIANGGGAWLDAGVGTGTVTVLNSAFNNNPNGVGLIILARNAVRVENVSAAGNGKVAYGGGLYINYRTRLTLKNIYAYDNFDHGIYAADTHPTLGGPVTLDNINASDNDGWEGIRLNNPGPVSGTNLTLNDNAMDDGIEVLNGRGAVALSGVTAVGNDYWGININTSGSVSLNTSRVADNDYGGLTITNKGTVSVKNSLFYLNTNAGGPGDGVLIDNSAAATPLGVTLTNLSVAQNAGYGIKANSKGTLTLSGITSRANGRVGAYLGTSGGGVTVSSSYGANSFVDNGTDAFCMGAAPDQTCTGLYIDAKGSVSVSGASANGNRLDGMGILNASSTRVSASFANNNFRGGVAVSGKGSITLDRVTALHNGTNGSGVYLTNTSLTAGNPSILLSHVQADHNDIGIYIASRGPVTLNHASASYNSKIGIFVDNYLSDTGLGAVTLTNSLGSDLVSYNTQNNLVIISKGSVSLRGVNASGSLTEYGALIQNSYSASSAGVSISSSDFNGNGNDTGDIGLVALSKGSISLNAVNASNNKGMGAALLNQFATLTGKTVSVSKGSFNNNGRSGLNIRSKSAVTLNNVSTNGNAYYGADIDNYQAGNGTGNVTISSSLGRNQFSNNGYAGLYMVTAGSVSVSNAEASRNAPGGAYSGFTIMSFGTAKTATFTCVSAANNGSYGIDFNVAAGSIKPTLKGVWLGGNGVGGLFYTGTVTYYYAVTCP